MIVISRRAALLCATALMLPGAVAAQTASTHADHAEADIVVTANRTPMRLDQVGQSVTVVNEKAIDAMQAVGVTELLAQTPGVEYVRNGGPGKATSIFIRGAETGQTVILYDGVRLNDPSSTDTGASMSDIVAGDIGRIEVLRGAQSTLWGSQAIGGVINIISRDPKKPLEANAQAEGGGLDTYYVKGGVGGKQDGLTWRAGAGYFSTKGVSAIAGGAEPDGYENFTAHARVAYDVASAVTVDLRSFYSWGRTEYDGFASDAPVYGKSKQLLNYAGLNFGLFGRLKNRIAYSNTDIIRVNYDDSPARAPQPVTFDARGTTDRYEYQGTLTIAEGWLAVFGAERAENWMRTASPTVAAPKPAPAAARDRTDGLYLQVQGEVIPGLTLTGGVRHEDHSSFGVHTVGSASAAWSLNGGDTVLRASWAQGFKAPSLYQLYSQYGNVALVPETAESWDMGVEQRIVGHFSVSAVYFRRSTENLVQFNSCTVATASHPLCAAPRIGFYDNVGRVRAQGLELGASATFGQLSASANYTYLDAINTTPGDPNNGKQLIRRPRHVYNATVNYTLPFGLALGASLRHSGNNWVNAANTQSLAGYTTVDFRASYPLTKSVELYGRVENAFDEKYQTILGYGTYPRVAYGGIRARF